MRRTWKVNSRVTVNAGLRYDLQFLSHQHGTTSPRVSASPSPPDSRRTIVRGSAGLFFDRVPLRALANALLSAGNTSDPSKLQQISLSLSPTQTGAPVFPNILRSAPSTTALFNLTTMDRNMQNAYSRQASVEVEQQVGPLSTVSVGYQYLRGLHLIMSVNQNVPTCVAVGTNNGCRPNPTYANNSQYSPVADSNYHGVHVSFVQRPTRWGNYRVTYTLSKSMDNVGQNFFSQPIDPTDLSKDWGRSDDDQRHRLVLYGSINSPMTPATTAWERISHGFQFSSMLQSYSALPLNITSGVTTIAGTAGRPVVNGAFIGRNTGTGPDFFSLSLRINRTFAIGRSVQIEGLAEGFNLTNRVNVVTINSNFGSGAYRRIRRRTSARYAVGDPEVSSFGRVRFWERRRSPISLRCSGAGFSFLRLTDLFGRR
jgi:hypothetical protein